MDSYIIEDKKVLEELEKEGIAFERTHFYWFDVDIEKLNTLNNYEYMCENGTILKLSGTKLHIEGEINVNEIPGRYMGFYHIEDKNMLDALIENGYTVIKLDKDYSHHWYEVNVFIPEDVVCLLPDKREFINNTNSDSIHLI